MKVYELKKGTQILYQGEVITFEEIRGEKAIFYNEYQEEFEFPDFFYVEEIGEILKLENKTNFFNSPTLF